MGRQDAGLKVVTDFTTALAKEDPDKYVENLQSLNAIGEQTVLDYGRDAALAQLTIHIKGWSVLWNYS